MPSILVDRARQNATHPEKSDSLDALGVAKVMIQSIDTLLPYTISQESQKAKQLKEISIDREDLVLERTRLKIKSIRSCIGYTTRNIQANTKTRFHLKHFDFGEMLNLNVIHFF